MAANCLGMESAISACKPRHELFLHLWPHRPHCVWYHPSLQDFALEPDEGRMRKAAHLMVSSLAGSLALVTCKDPLKVALTNTLRALINQVRVG
jgi:hypothetical protein